MGCHGRFQLVYRQTQVLQGLRFHLRRPYKPGLYAELLLKEQAVFTSTTANILN